MLHPLKYAMLLCCLSGIYTSKAQEVQLPKLQSGDLLFQNLDCGPLCNAIEAVTEGFNHHDFSHIGLVYVRQDSIYIIEAIGKNVHLTPLDIFIQRSANPIYTGRVKKQYSKMVKGAVEFALQQCGTTYDDVFIYNNGKYYCSELIYDAFKKANNDKPFFELEPMTFKIPGKESFFPAWIDYYQKLGIAIPEGEPGINPGGISRSNKLDIISK
jgi:hypothetical protein